MGSLKIFQYPFIQTASEGKTSTAAERMVDFVWTTTSGGPAPIRMASMLLPFDKSFEELRLDHYKLRKNQDSRKITLRSSALHGAHPGSAPASSSLISAGGTSFGKSGLQMTENAASTAAFDFPSSGLKFAPGKQPEANLTFGSFGDPDRASPDRTTTPCTCSHCLQEETDAESSLKTVLSPYLNVAVNERRTDLILQDARLKLSGLDAETGLGLIHRLLVDSDDVETCEQLLEIGLEPDFPCICYPGRSGLGSAACETLDGGTAVHFAAYFGRENCFRAFLEVGADLESETAAGLSVEDLANVAIKEQIAAWKARGRPTLASLAEDKKYFAIRFLMRCGKVTKEDLKSTSNGKTAGEWIWTHMTEWSFDAPDNEDSLVPFKIMSELKFRYAQAAGKKFACPTEMKYLSIDCDQVKKDENLVSDAEVIQRWLDGDGGFCHREKENLPTKFLHDEDEA